LRLRIELPNGYAQLGPGFYYPDTSNSERQIFPVSPINELIQDWIIKYPPPAPVICGFGSYPFVYFIYPVWRHLDLRPNKIWPYHGASRKEKGKQD
jgi:hypothetical protein